MNFIKLIAICLLSVFFLFGCTAKKDIDIEVDQALIEELDLDRTIGAFGEIYAPSDITVEGFGIVAGLDGRGSSECPPQIRENLIKYIQQMLGNANRLEAMRFLNSTDNAVVYIYGKIPAGSSRGDRFDVAVQALASTQTTSLSGGSLYTSELMASSRLGIAGARRLATAEGAVFIDWADPKQADPRSGRIIGGGRVGETSKMYIELFSPNYALAGFIRDRINERFGAKTSQAVSSEIITITPPQRYAGQHRKFAALIGSLYLPETNESLNNRIQALTASLKQSGNATNAEMGLEAIGRLSLRSLRELLSDENELVRLRAARCMLNIGYENAIYNLMEIAYNTDSKLRLEAINAVKQADLKPQSHAPLRKLLSDDDFEVRFAAYEILRQARDMSVSNQITMAGFSYDTVVSTGKPAVYIYREKFQRVVAFGNSIKLNSPIFIRDEASGVTINASENDEHITLIRKDVANSGIIGPVVCDYNLRSLVYKLTDNVSTQNKQRSGLGLDYSGVAILVKRLADNGCLDAEFHLGKSGDIEIIPPAAATATE